MTAEQLYGRSARAGISASLMCADQLNLERDISALQLANVDFLHLDVMDGNYVPNITLGIDACNAIMRTSELPADIHLLVAHPEELVPAFDFGRGDIVSAHFDCLADVRRLASIVHERGATFGVVLNPADQVADALPTLAHADLVSLMMIEPGFAGRAMLPGSLEKIADTRRALDAAGLSGIPIEIDGNVSAANAPAMRRNGGNLFVAGSSSVFQAGASIAEGVEALRQALSD